MGYKVLVTGGAGFIGSHLVNALIKGGHEVTVLDALVPQVHESGEVPDYLDERAEFVKGEIGDKELISSLLKDHEVIFHDAAAVGVGQSMYQIEEYVRANTLGTSTLLDSLVNKEHAVKKLIVAASMSSYGEGKYECKECGVVCPPLREEEQLKRKEWEMKCPECEGILKPLPTDEEKPLKPTSIYAITKMDQELMCLVTGRTYGIPTVSLRYFNVYGARQALSNPYTGVCAIFSCRIKNDNPPVIFEDGNQTRDFVHVSDIVQANLLAMEKKNANYETFNVGTGRAISIKEVAEALLKYFGKEPVYEITERFRKGDIRHCFSDISKLSRLGYSPKVKFEDGIPELVEWVVAQPVCDASDRFDVAINELNERKLAL